MFPNNNQFQNMNNMTNNMQNQFGGQMGMNNMNPNMNFMPQGGFGPQMMNPMMMGNTMAFNNMGFGNNMNMMGMNNMNNMMGMNNMNNMMGMNNMNMAMNNMMDMDNNMGNNDMNMNNQMSLQQQQAALEALKKKEEEDRQQRFRDIINNESSGQNISKIDTISDMANMGAITRNYIEIDSSQNPQKYLPIPQALSSNDQDYFVLGVLADYLQKQGVVTAIEKRDQNQLSKEKLKEIDTFLQFLINGLSNLKKHEFRFDFGWEKNNILLTDPQKQQGFMDELKVALSRGLKTPTSDIIITYPRSGSIRVTVIFLSEDFNNISLNQIQGILQTQAPSINALMGLDSYLVLDGILLNPELLDKKGDNLNQGWGYNEKRGGRPYYPPKGWLGYGLKVWGKYDKGNNEWISYNGGPGEWCVAYHGASQKLNQNYKAMRDVEDCNHPGQKVGEGVYCSPNPSVLDQEGGIVQVGNSQYKIGFMLRVKPNKIRIAKNNQNYWVLNGNSDEIRPYRILIKKIN